MINKQRARKIIRSNAIEDDSGRATTFNIRTENKKAFVLSQNTAGRQKEKGVAFKKETQQSSVYNATDDIALKKIDSVSLFMFPTIFFLFTVVYSVLFKK